MTLRLDAIEGADEAAAKAITDALIAYNRAQAGEHGYAELTLALRDAEGAAVGGLVAESYYEWMFIRLLAVPDAYRGQGWGTRLLQAAEASARRRGLTGIWLDTFGFQARPFYERHGFRCFGGIDDYPAGWGRFFMQKRLDGAG